MIDMLENIFRMQRDLQARIGIDLDNMTDADRADALRVNAYALEDEIHEALRETRWKPWAKPGPVFRDRAKYVEELVDSLHFFVNLCLHGGISADELYREYLAKNLINHERQDSGSYDGIGELHDSDRVR